MQQEGNFNNAEIAKFSALAIDWWNPFGNCKPLHAVNPLRFNFIQKYTALSDLRILDIGCGGGILTESLAKAGGDVMGIDMSKEAIDVAKEHAKQQGLVIEYELNLAEELAKQHAGEFDIITCMELLEHVPAPMSLITACSKLLKNNGHIFFSTINRRSKAYLYAILGAEYLLKLLPKGTHRYDKFIRPIEMFNMLQKEDLQLAHMAGITYHPISRTYSLTEDVSVNYLLHCYKDQTSMEISSLD